MTKEIATEIQNTISELEPKAKSGEAYAQHQLFVLLFGEAMENYDSDLFDKAEYYLIKSAENGYPEAIEALTNQQLRRYAFEQRVKRYNDKISDVG